MIPNTPPFYQYGGAARDPATAVVTTVLLAINDNKADTTTAFDDESTSNKTLTANGDVQYDTAQAPTGRPSRGLFDGTGDFISTPDHDDWDFGTGDFTVECMVRFNSRTGVVSLVSNYSGWSFQSRNDGDRLTFYWGDAELSSAWTWAPSNGVWYHVAVCRSGTNLRGFVDGTQVGSTVTNSTNITGALASLNIGRLPINVQYLNGWMACVRVAKGLALYTGNFTPPSLPLSA